MNKKKYKLLISGHSGYIGSFFCKFLKEKNIKFIKFDYKKFPKNLKRYTHFFHFDFKIKREKNSIKKNSQNLLRVLNLCIKNDIKFIFPSTASFKYNSKKKRVSSQISPVNDYTLSKFICEKKILEFHKKKKLNYFIFRIFNVYGDNTRNRWVVASLIKKFRKFKKVQIDNSGNYRDFLNLTDLSILLIKSLDIKKNGIYEVGSGRAISIKNLANLIKKILKKNIYLDFTKPFSSKKNFYSQAQIYETKKIFSWRPKIGLKKGLKSLIISKK